MDDEFDCYGHSRRLPVSPLLVDSKKYLALAEQVGAEAACCEELIPGLYGQHIWTGQLDICCRLASCPVSTCLIMKSK